MTRSTNGREADTPELSAYDERMKDLIEIALLAAALIAAWLAGSRHAQRHSHPHYVHHSIGFIAVAILAGAALIISGPR